jgi:alkylhydroperoxidase family enzyme
MVARAFGRRGVPAVFVLLARHRRLFWTWLLFAAQMMPYGRLPAIERELLILRTAWLCRCRYEWGQHVQMAVRVGVADADIVRVTEGASAFESARVRVMLEACDELLHDASLAAPTLAMLRTYLDARDITELTMLVGHYRMLAGLINAAALPLDADMEAELTAFEARVEGMRTPE